jgi:hypothetical protein
MTGEARLAQIDAELLALPSERQAAFFWLAGEALLPLYDAVSDRHGWGDPSRLRAAQRLTLDVLAGTPVPPDVAAVLDELLVTAPHGDDIDAPDSTHAQGAVICVDAALRCAVYGATPARSSYYVFEPLLTAGRAPALAAAVAFAEAVIGALATCTDPASEAARWVERAAVLRPARGQGHEPEELRGAAAEAFARGHLHEVGKDLERWTVDYVDPATGDRWIKDYPQGHLQGGGSARLRRSGGHR